MLRKDFTLETATARKVSDLWGEDKSSSVNYRSIEQTIVTYVLRSKSCMHSTVENCSSEGSVTGHHTTGGLIGKILYISSVDNFFSKGTVTGISSHDGAPSYYTGGITGNIIGLSDNGWYPSINNSYSTSDVSGAYNTGGLSGVIQDCNINYCYCVGSVSNSELTVGGFTGSAHENYTVTRCFWNVETDGLTETSGGDNNYGATGKTTTQMKTESTFTAASWNFTTIWDIDAGVSDGYPYLLQNAPDVPLPIGLSALNVTTNNGVVIVTWVTESETENAAFRIYRDGEIIAELEGAGTTTEPQNYTYTDQYVIPGRTYTYVLADVDLQGKETKHPEVEVKVEAEAEDGVDIDHTIGKAYPNPFNPVTMVPLNLAAPADVRAFLYDLSGRMIRELYNAPYPPVPTI
ncbi:MAG: hypothetical protein U5N26_07155 [Candidatus Marinimicrobia bacterium]|nr:hypothetical protein [Candidatus Neomarinimicrobiota bacterium]